MKIEDIRRKETLSALMSFMRQVPYFEAEKYLDFGCGDGTFTVAIAKVLNVKKNYGLDIDHEELGKAKLKGIYTCNVDLNTETLPFDEGEFDVASAFDVIEHLWNTDNLLNEAFRILRPGSYFVITTPNLASWANRLLLLFGYLPYHYGCSFRYQLEKRPLQTSSGLCEHIRLYTFDTLKRHLESYGFKVIHSTCIHLAYTSSNTVVKILDKILSMKKTQGAGIFLIAIKNQGIQRS